LVGYVYAPQKVMVELLTADHESSDDRKDVPLAAVDVDVEQLVVVVAGDGVGAERQPRGRAPVEADVGKHLHGPVAPERMPTDASDNPVLDSFLELLAQKRDDTHPVSEVGEAINRHRPRSEMLDPRGCGRALRRRRFSGKRGFRGAGYRTRGEGLRRHGYVQHP